MKGGCLDVEYLGLSLRILDGVGEVDGREAAVQYGLVSPAREVSRLNHVGI